MRALGSDVAAMAGTLDSLLGPDRLVHVCLDDLMRGGNGTARFDALLGRVLGHLGFPAADVNNLVRLVGKHAPSRAVRSARKHMTTAVGLVAETNHAAVTDTTTRTEDAARAHLVDQLSVALARRSGAVNVDQRQMLRDEVRSLDAQFFGGQVARLAPRVRQACLRPV